MTASAAIWDWCDVVRRSVANVISAKTMAEDINQDGVIEMTRFSVEEGPPDAFTPPASRRSQRSSRRGRCCFPLLKRVRKTSR